VLRAPDIEIIKKQLVGLHQKGIESLAIAFMHAYIFPNNEATKIIRMPSLPGPSTTSVLFFSIGDISNVCKAAARGSVSVAMSGAKFEGISCRVPAATLTSSAKAPS
jgi:N-methylhydantoinase A/oxoprolinase/acetone carboxylase beta subunit